MLEAQSILPQPDVGLINREEGTPSRFGFHPESLKAASLKLVQAGHVDFASLLIDQPENCTLSLPIHKALEILENSTQAEEFENSNSFLARGLTFQNALSVIGYALTDQAFRVAHSESICTRVANSLITNEPHEFMTESFIQMLLMLKNFHDSSEDAVNTGIYLCSKMIHEPGQSADFFYFYENFSRNVGISTELIASLADNYSQAPSEIAINNLLEGYTVLMRNPYLVEPIAYTLNALELPSDIKFNSWDAMHAFLAELLCSEPEETEINMIQEWIDQNGYSYELLTGYAYKYMDN